MDKKRLFFASTNQGKIGEVKAILEPLDITVLTIHDVPAYEDVEETGATFIAIARLKADAGYTAAGIATLAEDAGIEVFGLDMEPGIYSARYMGAVPQAEKNLNIISRLDELGCTRAARFHSAMVLIPGNDRGTVVAEGFCYGEIAREPAGDNGFGYDPVFLLPELGRTMAELEKEEKNSISHRRNALHAIAQRLALMKKEQ